MRGFSPRIPLTRTSPRLTPVMPSPTKGEGTATTTASAASAGVTRDSTAQDRTLRRPRPGTLHRRHADGFAGGPAAVEGMPQHEFGRRFAGGGDCHGRPHSD